MGYTLIGNKFIDEIMATVPPSAVPVYLVIVRQTIGWNRPADVISISQFVRLTGMARNTITKGIQSLIDAGVISRQIKTANGNDCYEYTISNFEHGSSNFEHGDSNIEHGSANIEHNDASNIERGDSNIERGGGANFEPPPLQNLNTQNKYIKKTKKKTNNDTTTGASTDGATVQPMARDPRLDSWQIKCYREIARLTPPFAARDGIINTVTDETRWREVLQSWIAKGYRPQNIDGMLNYYTRFAPEKEVHHGTQSQPIQSGFGTTHKELINGRWQEVSIDEYIRRHETLHD